MKLSGFVSRAMNLREAAAVIFVLVALLPLLLFVAFLSVSNLISKTEAQFAAFMALIIACLGFVVFRRMVDQIARLAVNVKLPIPADQEGLRTPTRRPCACRAWARSPRSASWRAPFTRCWRTSGPRRAARGSGLQAGHAQRAGRDVHPHPEDPGSPGLGPAEHHAGGSRQHRLDHAARPAAPDAAHRGLARAARRGPRARPRCGSGRAWRARSPSSGDAVIVDDIEKDARFAKLNDPKYGTGSFICMPVRVGDRVIGVINLAKKEDAGTSPPTPRPFSPTDLQFLSTLLTYIAYAVDNARLLQEARQSATQLQNVVDDLRATQAQLVRGRDALRHRQARLGHGPPPQQPLRGHPRPASRLLLAKVPGPRRAALPRDHPAGRAGRRRGGPPRPALQPRAAGARAPRRWTSTSSAQEVLDADAPALAQRGPAARGSESTPRSTWARSGPWPGSSRRCARC